MRGASDTSTVLLLMATLALVGGVSIAFKNIVDHDVEAEDRDPPPRSAGALAQEHHVTLEPRGGRWGSAPAPLPPDDAPTVVVTSTSIFFDGAFIAPLPRGDGGLDVRYKRDPNDLLIVPLVQALGARCERVREAGASGPCTLRVLTDQTAPTRVLNEVAFTAGVAGYANVRPIVRETDGGLGAVGPDSTAPRDGSRPAPP